MESGEFVYSKPIEEVLETGRESALHRGTRLQRLITRLPKYW